MGSGRVMGRSAQGGQGGSEQRIEVFVKIQKKYFGGGGGGSDGGQFGGGGVGWQGGS